MAGVKGMHESWKRSPRYAEAVRARIRAGGIVKRLEDHILGTIELSATQVSAALGLLRKTVPDLATVEHTGKDGGPIETRQVKDDELARWLAFETTQRVIEKAKA